MMETAFGDEALLAQMLKLHGITIEESWRPSILANMRAIGRAAELLMTMDLDEAVEPAPVYQASAE
jgi:hypothetical protein